MFNPTEEKRFLHNANTGVFPPEKPRFTMTEDIHHTKRRMEEVIDRLLKFEERVKNDMYDISRSLTSDNVIFKDTMNTAYLTFLQEVKNEVNMFESNVDNTIKLFQTDIETNYATLDERVFAKVDELENKYDEEYTTFKTSIQELTSSFMEGVNSRIDANNSTFEQAFADYQQKATTEINMFEATVNNTVENFVESVNNSIQVFKETWEQIITERLNSQDSKLDDAELYMRTNLVGTVTALVGDMEAQGKFADIIEGEVFNEFEKRTSHIVTPQMFGAVADGEADDTTAFETLRENAKSVFIPRGKYVISKSLDFRGINIEGEKDTFIYFNNTEGNGLIVGNATVKNINLVMMNNFSGALMKVDEGIVNAYPEKTIIENVCMYSLNEDYVGTFIHINPYNNYGSIFEKIKIGRMNETITSQDNKALNGILVEVNEEWGNGYTFRDIIIDGYILNPIKVVSDNYLNCTNFIFENVQVQEKNREGFKHNSIAHFEGVKDLFLINCKVWDYSDSYTTNRVVYKNTSNVSIVNSPVFDKYFNTVNPFINEGSEIGYKENRKLFNSKMSENNNYTGMCEVLNIEGTNEQAIPYLIPFTFTEFLYSKMMFEMWTRLNYGTKSGDNFTRVELMQTSYIKNVLYMNKATSTLETIKKIKKYNEGIVIWLRGGIGELNYNCESGGRLTNASNLTLTTSEGTSEVVSVEAWDNTYIPECKTLSIINTTVIDSTTTV